MKNFKKKISFASFGIYIIMVVVDRVLLRNKEILLLNINGDDYEKLVTPLASFGIWYKVLDNCLYVKRKDKEQALSLYYNSVMSL